MDGFFDAVTDNTTLDTGNANTDDSGILVANPSKNTSSIVMGMSSTDDYSAIIDDKTNTNTTDINQNSQSTTIPMGLVENNPYEHKQNIDNDQQQQQPTSGDIFAGLGDDAQMANETEEEKDNNADKTDDEPTFLSVWTDQRRNELEDRRQSERDSQSKSLAEAQEILEQFHSDRNARIVAKQKENRIKEEQLREDLNSTFEHGTIWEQVGKMVSLQETESKSKGSDRMRVLLIHLKNAKQ